MSDAEVKDKPSVDSPEKIMMEQVAAMSVPTEAQPEAETPPAALPAPTPDATADKEPEPEAELNIDAFDPPPDVQLRLEQVSAAANPLLEAAQPLLRALAEMPPQVKNLAQMNCLHAMLAREINAFQKLCDKADLSWKHMAAVRFCLCTALDEAANRSNLGGGSAWAVKSLLIEIEGESDGGEKFFLLIGRMATDPQEYRDVLEVLYRILGLGFEGRYSVVEDGRRHLDQIRQRLLTLIGSARETVPPELSPHWRGEGAGRLPLLRSVPVWATASFFALILFGVFCWYQYQLLGASNALQQHILAIAKEPAPASVPLPPAAQPLRLAILLKEEIARGLVTVADDARRSAVTFKGDTMFVAGQSQVRPEIEPTLDKVAREVARVGGHVRIIGHTDSQPIRTAEFPNNQVLSEKRAAFVGQYLQSRGTPAGRIETLGRGDSLPVAGNATAAERARNRRVEIVVTK